MDNTEINICQASDSYLPIVDGVAIVMKNYLEILSNKNRLCLVIPKIKGGENIEYPFGCEVVRIPKWRWFPLTGGYPVSHIRIHKRLLFKKLDEFNPDIIHIHSPFTLSQGLIRYAKKRNIPLCITIHTKFESDLPRTTHSKIITHMMMKTVKHAIQYADAVFTVNKLMAEHIKKTYKLPNIKISVVQNATEMLPYKEKEAAANEINSLYGIRPEEKVFIFISRIVTNKNIGFLVDTFKEYVKINDNFKFLVMGDGREFSWFKKEIEEAIGTRAIFTGMVHDRTLVQKALLRADLCVFPSLYDTNSLTISESACNFTPMLVIKDSTTSIDIKDNVNGYLSENDPIAFSKRMSEIVNDDVLLKKVSNNANKSLYITFEDSCKKLVELYRDTIKKKK